MLIVLYVGSQLLSSILTPSTADRNQRMLMYALPFVFLIFVIRFPAGLIVYWITTNLWTVTQGYVLRRRMGPISMPKAEPALAGARRRGRRWARRRVHGADGRGHRRQGRCRRAGAGARGQGRGRRRIVEGDAREGPRSNAASATKAGGSSSAKLRRGRREVGRVRPRAVLEVL